MKSDPIFGQGGTEKERPGLHLPEAERLRKSSARVGRRSAHLADAERDPARADADPEARGLRVDDDAHALVVAHDDRPRALAEGRSRGEGRVVAAQVLYLGEAEDPAGPFERTGPEAAEHEAVDAYGVGPALELHHGIDSQVADAD